MFLFCSGSRSLFSGTEKMAMVGSSFGEPAVLFALQQLSSDISYYYDYYHFRNGNSFGKEG